LAGLSIKIEPLFQLFCALRQTLARVFVPSGFIKPKERRSAGGGKTEHNRCLNLRRNGEREIGDGCAASKRHEGVTCFPHKKADDRCPNDRVPELPNEFKDVPKKPAPSADLNIPNPLRL
jgi:hypothetical protein